MTLGCSVMLVSQSTQTSPLEVGASEPNIANPPCLRCGFTLRALSKSGDNASFPNPLWLTIRAPMSTEIVTANSTLSDPMTHLPLSSLPLCPLLPAARFTLRHIPCLCVQIQTQLIRHRQLASLKHHSTHRSPRSPSLARLHCMETKRPPPPPRSQLPAMP